MPDTFTDWPATDDADALTPAALPLWQEELAAEEFSRAATMRRGFAGLRSLSVRAPRELRS